MNDIALRIKELIDNENLSNKEFAQRISINPSIVSHILSGRNKVSLQVVEQIVSEFTNVSLDYLLLGKGALEKDVTNVNYNSNSAFVSPPNTVELEKQETIAKEVIPEPEKKVEVPLPLVPSNSDIDQIIIFYSDGSFKIYKP